MSDLNSGRPGPGGYGAAQERDGAGSILSPDVDKWQRLALHIDGAFVMVVETTHGKYRRRVWLTLAAAERAAEKARDAGHDAVVMLAELKPLQRGVGRVARRSMPSPCIQR